MSRYAGVWSGTKTIQEIAESSATADRLPTGCASRCPEDLRDAAGGVHIRWPDAALEQEARPMHNSKWYAALAYVRANRLNHNVIEGPKDRFRIMASGKAYNDTRQALRDLGFDEASCRALGIRAHKVAGGVAAGSEHHPRLRRPAGNPGGGGEAPGHRAPAWQRALLTASDVRPNVLGKFDEVGEDQFGGE